MALYFFHERSGHDYIVDEHGIDMPDLATVQREAMAGAREIVAAAVLKGRLSLRDCLEIFDAQGALVMRLPFSSVVAIDG